MLSVLGLLVALVLAEILLRGPLRPDRITDRNDDWQIRTRTLHARLHQPDPDLIYTPIPGASMEMDYGPVEVNAAGGRGTLTSARVAMLGDSLVWGELLADKDTIPARLQERLGQPVLNFGVTGYSTRQEADWYARTVRAHRPDVVVLVYCLNDMLMMSGPMHLYATPDVRRQWLDERNWIQQTAPLRNESISRMWLGARSSGGLQVLAAMMHTGRWLRLFTLPGGYTDEFLIAAADPERLHATRQALADLGEMVRQDGAEAVLVISPALYWWHHYQWEDLHTAVAEAGRAAGFSVLDPPREGKPDRLRYAGDNLHYTPEGANWLAGAIADHLWSDVRIADRLNALENPLRGGVGGVVEDLNLQPIRRPVQRRNGGEQSIDHRSLAAQRKLHGDERSAAAHTSCLLSTTHPEKMQPGHDVQRDTQCGHCVHHKQDTNPGLHDHLLYSP